MCIIIIKRLCPRLGHSCLQKSAPSISLLRSMPGRVETNVTWLQIGLNSAGPGVCWASSPSFSIPWRLLIMARRAWQWSISGWARAISAIDRICALNLIVQDRREFDYYQYNNLYCQWTNLFLATIETEAADLLVWPANTNVSKLTLCRFSVLFYSWKCTFNISFCNWE